MTERAAAGSSLLGDPRLRAWTLQALTLLAVAAGLAYVVHNTAVNLERQGIASGFGFLWRTAGFDIIQHLVPYGEDSTYGRAFVVAFVNTLAVSAFGVALATALGFALGIARLSRNWLVARLALVYVEIVRNVPLLLQLFFWYFGVLRALPPARESLSLGGDVYLNIRGLYMPAPVPEPGFAGVAATFVVATVAGWLSARRSRRCRVETGRGVPGARLAVLGVVTLTAVAYIALGRPLAVEAPVLTGFNFSGGLALLPELVALLLALTIYTAAFIAEIVRAGILAVSHGQWEAAQSLGLGRGQVLRLVVVPQAMRVIVPPMTNQYLNLTKNSSLAAAIAYPDLVLVFAGTVLVQTGQAVEVIAITMAVYLALSLSISYGMNRYNRRVALVER